jgi:hypothetical protein
MGCSFGGLAADYCAASPDAAEPRIGCRNLRASDFALGGYVEVSVLHHEYHHTGRPMKMMQTAYA